MNLLKQSTDATIHIGPAVDVSDGVTPESGLAAGTVDEIGVYKNAATALTDLSGTTTFTHRAGGTYTMTLSTSDTGTLGHLRALVRDDSVCLPMWRDFMVVPANIYDSLVGGSDKLEVDSTLIEGGDATDAINAACDTALSDYDGPTNAEMEARTLAAAAYFDPATDDVTVGTNNDKTGYSISGTKTTLDALNDIDGTSVTATTVSDKTGYSLSSAGVQAIWDALTTAMNTANSVGKLIKDYLNVAVSSRATASEVNDEVDTALADYDGPTNAEMNARTLAAASYATAANQTTILNRLGAWTGTGVNTVLGAFKALLSKAASAPSDIGGTFDPSTDSTEAIRDTEPLGTAMRGTDGANTTTPPTTAEIKTELEANGTKIDHLWEMTEDDGGTRRLTTNALEQAPSGGGGGDATEANQTTIITHLTDMKGATFAGSTDSLEAIRNRGDAAWTTGGTGSGDTAVNADTEADDGNDLAYKTSGGAGIGGAVVRAYVASEYATSGTQATLRGETSTADDGSWVSDLQLNTGTTYTIWFWKQGEYGPDTQDVTP